MWGMNGSSWTRAKRHGGQMSWPRSPVTLRVRTFAQVMTVANGLFFDVLGRATLVEVAQDLQEGVERRLSARLLYPDVEQRVDPVFVEEVVLVLDHVVVDAELTKEPLVIVQVKFLKIREATAQRLFACEQRNRPSDAAAAAIMAGNHQMCHNWGNEITALLLDLATRWC